MDELGRIALPVEIRRSLEFKDFQKVEIYMEGERTICISQVSDHECALCGSDQELIEIDGKYICGDCYYKAGQALGA